MTCSRPVPLCFLLLTTLWLGLASRAAGQEAERVTLTGTVTAEDTGLPLPGAHVILAGSTTGTVTDLHGRYTLPDLPVDAYRVHVSMLGFEPTAVDTALTAPGRYIIDIALPEAVLELQEAEVTATRDRRWERRLARFKEEFIGTSERAEQTELLNPEVLSFTSRWGRFRAEAAAPLRLRNHALGYDITYHLTHFSSTGTRIQYDGDRFYAPMTPDSPEQAAAWEAARAKAYRGSLQHFLHAVMDDRVDEAGFVVYQLPRVRSLGLRHARDGAPRFRGRTHRFFDTADDGAHYELDFRGQLEILYRGAPEPPAYVDWLRDQRRVPRDFRTAYLSLNERPAIIDRYGDVVKPFAVTRYGYYAFTRIADSLPKAYRPGH